MSPEIGLLLGLGVAVAFGAVIPIVPTGAAVSAAAVVATGGHPLQVVLVIGAGALGAYVGDVTVYAVLRWLGEPMAQRLGWINRDDPQGAVRRIRAQLEEHELRTLLLSRLIPGGRAPVLVAAALGGYPLVRFASAAVASAALWSVAYASIGILGDTVLPDGSVALIVVVVTAVVIGAVVPYLGRAKAA